MRIDIPGKGPIEFEGLVLPEEAKHFEVLPFFSELSSDVAKFALDLRYAWGRNRSATSEIVLKACNELENGLEEHRDKVCEHLVREFKDDSPAQTCETWNTIIQQLREIAEDRQECTWTIDPIDNEPEFFLNQMVGLIKGMEKEQGETVLSREFLEGIETGSDADKVAFVIQVTDSLSDPQ